MYKFVIKGVNGAIKYVSKNNYYSVSQAQAVGFVSKQGFMYQNRYSITESDTIDVEIIESECVNSELSSNSANHLLAQQY